MWPDGSRMTPPLGKPPSLLPLNVYSTVSFPPGPTLNVTPHPYPPKPLVLHPPGNPPTLVVPYRLPFASMVRTSVGYAPAVQLERLQKLYSVVSFQGWPFFFGGVNL